MYTIAEEVGMSVAAVSRAFDANSRLKPEKRQLIFETAERLGYVPNKMASRLSGEPMRLGILIYGVLPVFYNEYISGFQNAYSEYMDYKVSMDLRVLPVTEYTDADVYAVLDTFIQDNCEGVILSGMSYSRHLPQLNRLTKHHIPYILLNCDLPQCQRSGVSCNDVETAGAMAAQLLHSAIHTNHHQTETKHPIALFTVNREQTSQIGLTDSFCRAADTYDLDVVRICLTRDDPVLASAMLEELLTEYPGLAGIYITSANSVSICRKLCHMGLGGKVAVVASDIFTELAEFIRQDVVFASIYQNPFAQAKDAFSAMFSFLSDKISIPEYIQTRPEIVMKSNLSLYWHPEK